MTDRLLPAATKLSPKHKKALAFVSGVLGLSESELIRHAVIERYDLEEIAEQEADSFFADRARLIEHYEQRMHNRVRAAAITNEGTSA